MNILGERKGRGVLDQKRLEDELRGMELAKVSSKYDTFNMVTINDIEVYNWKGERDAYSKVLFPRKPLFDAIPIPRKEAMQELEGSGYVLPTFPIFCNVVMALWKRGEKSLADDLLYKYILNDTEFDIDTSRQGDNSVIRHGSISQSLQFKHKREGQYDTFEESIEMNMAWWRHLTGLRDPADLLALGNKVMKVYFAKNIFSAQPYLSIGDNNPGIGCTLWAGLLHPVKVIQ